MNTPPYKLGYGDYLRFRELVLSYSGLYFPEKKRIDLEIGLLKALQNAPNGISDPDSYYHYLQGKTHSRAVAAELRRLVNLLTVGETHFFRDDAQFDALANHVLPQLIAQKRTATTAVGTHPPGKPQLRVWSAGCASGEEVYSIAILLRELISDIDHWQIFILGTDINQDSLDKAKEAHYTDWSFRENRAKSMRALYFHKEGKRFRLRDDIRRMVTFARLNLIEDVFPAVHNNTVSMDLILCRNVTIYFTEKITTYLVSKFYDSLLPSGWLVTGHSEHSLYTYQAFSAQTFPKALLYRKTNQPSEWPDNWQSRDVLPANDSLPCYYINNTATTVKPLTLSPLPGANSANKQLATATKSSHPQPEGDIYERAKKLLDEGKSEQVIMVLSPCLSSLPQKQRAVAHCLLAKAYANQGQWEEAKGNCQRAIDLDILLAEAYFVLAMVNEFQEDLATAVTNLKRVLYLEHTHPLAHFNLAMLYAKTGQYPLARHTFRTLSNILQKYPPGQEIPDTDGSHASQMLAQVQKLLTELINEVDNHE